LVVHCLLVLCFFYVLLRPRCRQGVLSDAQKSESGLRATGQDDYDPKTAHQRASVAAGE
jgi:hypothetical protein